MRKIQKEQGITLIALVITVVILIILSTVTISYTFGEDKLIQKVENAKNLAEQSVNNGQEKLETLIGEFENIMEENFNVPEEGLNVKINCKVEDTNLNKGSIEVYSDPDNKNLLKTLPITGKSAELKLNTGIYYLDFKDTYLNDKKVNLLHIEDKMITVLNRNKNEFDFNFVEGTQLPATGDKFEGLVAVGSGASGKNNIKITVRDKYTNELCESAHITIFELGTVTNEEYTEFKFSEPFKKMGLGEYSRLYNGSVTYRRSLTEYALREVEQGILGATDRQGKVEFFNMKGDGTVYLITCQAEKKYDSAGIVSLPTKINETTGFISNLSLEFQIRSKLDSEIMPEPKPETIP